MAECIRQEPIMGPVAEAGPSWNGSAYSVNPLTGNGYFSVRVSASAAGVVVGLSGDPSGDGYATISHGITFQSGRFAIIEHGVVKTGYSSYRSDDTFYFYRIDGVVYYLRASVGSSYFIMPGEIIYTSALVEYGTVYLDASLFALGDKILEAELSDGTSGGSIVAGFDVGAIWSDEAYAQFISGLRLGALWTQPNDMAITPGLKAGAVWSDDEWASFAAGATLGGEWLTGLAPTVVEFVTSLTAGAAWESWIEANVSFLANLDIGAKWFADADQSDFVSPVTLGAMWVSQQSTAVNHIHVNLKLVGSQPALSRFAPIKAFPGYVVTGSTISIPLSNLDGLDASDADPETGDWTKIVKALLLAMRDQYESLDAWDQPVMARPWVMESTDLSAVPGNDMVSVQTDRTMIQYAFVIHYATQTLIEE